MKIKKLFIALIIVFTVVIMNGCLTNEENKQIQANLFDMLNGINISKQYLSSIIDGDMNEANNICSPELINKNKELSSGVSKIASFSLNNTIEGNNYGYFIFDVIRTSGVEPKSDLENMTIRIEKKDDKYLITEVKSKSQKELYVKGNSLRIIGDEGGKSNLVIGLNNIPKDTYLRQNEVMLYKDKVPNKSFGKVAFSFTGKRIAITTTNNEDSYVCIAFIDETLMTTANVNDVNSEGQMSGVLDEIQESLEKSVARKLVSVDLFKNSNINKFTFSKEEDTLEVEFTNKYNIKRVNLYNADDGNIINTNFNKEFPEDKYNITSGRFDDENYNFEVTLADSVKNTNDNLAGRYIFNLKTLQIKKL